MVGDVWVLTGRNRPKRSLGSGVSHRGRWLMKKNRYITSRIEQLRFSIKTRLRKLIDERLDKSCDGSVEPRRMHAHGDGNKPSYENNCL
jgi:hypothetical protein